MTGDLRDAILAYTDTHPGADGLWPTDVPNLHLIRGDRETALQHAFYDRALIVVVQGAKEVVLGDASFAYSAGQYLVMSVGLPLLASITEASDERPYLALALTIDFRILGELVDALDRLPDPVVPPRLGLFVGTIDGRQSAALARLGALLESPEALRVLYASVAREIFYWTLAGRDGAEIRRLAAPDRHTQRIGDAIAVLRADLSASVSIDSLAARAHMSPSSFHHHFKLVTSMSPLQYQKQLRLLEARRLMLAHGADATRAAFEVGYESASQFSREYARMFGAPPRRDVAGYRAASGASANRP